MVGIFLPTREFQLYFVRYLFVVSYVLVGTLMSVMLVEADKVI